MRKYPKGGQDSVLDWAGSGRRIKRGFESALKLNNKLTNLIDLIIILKKLRY